MPDEKDKIGYYYAILRYCPDVSIEEFANIGVLMWIPEIDGILWYLERRTDRLEAFWKNFKKDSFRALTEGLVHRFRQQQKLYLSVLSMEEQADLGIHPSGRFPGILESFINTPSVLPWSEIRSGISKEPAERMKQIVEEMIGANHAREIVTAIDGKFPELEWIHLGDIAGTGRTRYSALVPKGDRDTKQAYGYVSRLNDGRWQPEFLCIHYGGIISLLIEPSEIYARKAVRREVEKQFKAS